MKQLAVVNSIHIPTYVLAVVVSIISMFSLQLNNVTVDPSNPKDQAIIIAAVVGVILKALQMSSLTPTK